MMVLSFTLQSHSSSAEIQLGDSPEKGKRRVRFPVCVFGDNSWLGSPFKRPCWAQSFNKQRPTKPLYTSFLHRLFSFHLSPLPLNHYTSSLHSLVSGADRSAKVKFNELKWVYNNRFSCCHRSLAPSLFNLSNLFLAWSPVKKRLWGLLNRDPNRVSLSFMCCHGG